MRKGSVLAAVAVGTVAGKLINKLREADLRGQCALITGGSRGLGLLLAREFASQGCRVCICARDPAELDRARTWLQAEVSGAKVKPLECDVTRRVQVARAIGECTNWAGGIDILVNNAGTIQVGPAEDMRLEDYEQCLNLMFWGTLYPTLAVVPQMKERHAGRIVNITSIGGKISVPHLVPYSAAKFAAVGLSEGLHAELRRHGIRVTTVVPGLMRTGSYLNAFFKGHAEKEYRWFSLGATLPGISMSAERAARQIVSATRRGSAEVILSLPARAAALAHGLFPGATADVLALANRLLMPPPDSTRRKARGKELRAQAETPAQRALTSLGRRAARELNQSPEEEAA